nr:GDSL esterase/lipase At1g28590-like [Ipomoea batatas]
MPKPIAIAACPYTSIFAFGDSLTDVGNRVLLYPNHSHMGEPPYGETFFHHPTGRCSDGRLIIDFIECKEKLKSSLFVLGPFGSNDYRRALGYGKDIEEIRSYVPLVIDVITTAINDLIELGATTIMVPGILPDGCIGSVLTEFESDNKEDYDPDTGCLTWVNELSEYHNQHLQQRLNTIQHHNPDIVIIYADFYNATMELYRHPEKYGFISTLVVCCGEGGKYNLNKDVGCGDIQVKSCPEPWLYVDWDGNHMTDRANKIVSMALLDGTCLKLKPYHTFRNTRSTYPEKRLLVKFYHGTLDLHRFKRYLLVVITSGLLLYVQKLNGNGNLVPTFSMSSPEDIIPHNIPFLPQHVSPFQFFSWLS